MSPAEISFTFFNISVPILFFTCIGVVQFTFVPTPHCPFAFCPIAYTVLSLLKNSAWLFPCAIFIMFSNPGTNSFVDNLTTLFSLVIAYSPLISQTTSKSVIFSATLWWFSPNVYTFPSTSCA